jgi:two-component system LytT family response regulator
MTPIKLKAIQVDDEKIARETLKAYLEKYCPDIELLASCENIDQGYEAIQKFKPEVVFLDVEMPFGNAFDLLEKCTHINFETIFVTAFSHYAMKALNQSACYYLLKPIDITELLKAISKIKSLHSQSNLVSNGSTNHTQLLVQNLKSTHKNTQKIALPLMEGYEFVEINQIVRCQAQDNFTDVFLKNGKKLMICRTLKFYEELLHDFGFIRIHKSHLINPECALRYSKGKGGTLTMLDGSTIDVSPNKKQNLLSLFEK